MIMDQFEAKIGATSHKVTLLDDTRLVVDGQDYSYDCHSNVQGSLSLVLGGSVFNIDFVKMTGENQDNSIHLSINSSPYEVIVDDHRSLVRKRLQSTRPYFSKLQEVRAPMPGKVVRFEVKDGDLVTPGRGLLVLEAMKMENEIKSTVSGRVGAILAVTGQPVEKGEILLSINPS
jgi:biotin carboxyl carrier protein